MWLLGWRALRGLRALGADLLDPAQRVAELGQPGVAVLAGEPDAPGERVGPGAGDARVDQGVEDAPLGLAHAGHHRDGDRGEELGLRPAGSTPGDLPPELALGLAGHLDAPVAGVLAEPLDPALGGRGNGGLVRPLRRPPF